MLALTLIAKTAMRWLPSRDAETALASRRSLCGAQRRGEHGELGQFKRRKRDAGGGGGGRVSQQLIMTHVAYLAEHRPLPALMPWREPTQDVRCDVVVSEAASLSGSSSSRCTPLPKVPYQQPGLCAVRNVFARQAFTNDWITQRLAMPSRWQVPWRYRNRMMLITVFGNDHTFVVPVVP